MAEVDDKSLPGDRPLPLDELGNMFRFRWTRQPGGDYRVSLFVGPEPGRLQLAGTFVLRPSEMDDFSLNMGLLAGTRTKLGLEVSKWWLEEVPDA